MMNETINAELPKVVFTKHAKQRFKQRVRKVTINEWRSSASQYIKTIRGREKLCTCRVWVDGVQAVIDKDDRLEDKWVVITVLRER